MAKELYSSTGLRIVKNDVNQFCICTLHFTADPAKRAPEWKREASAGLTPEKFAREYNIDYTAVMGSRVFPEITSLHSDIVVPKPDFGKGVRYWGGLDYGTRNPSSFHVYTIVDGITYSVWELYRPCVNIPAFAAEMQAFPYWQSIRYIATDPSLWTPNQQQALGNLISIQEHFRSAGIKNLIKGRNDTQAEEAWVAQVRQAWRNPDDVTFKISETCQNQLREFETAIYVGQSERQLLSQSYRETIADVDNHSLDDCKYFMLSKPSPQQQLDWKPANMVERWQINSGQRQQSYQPMPTGRKPVGGYV